MTAPTFYQLDLDGYLVGPVTLDPDPLNAGNWLIPARCVGTEPPSTGANEAARWDAGSWSVLPDFRGLVYWLADGSRHEITARGISPPPDALDSQPVTLADAKAAKKNALDVLLGDWKNPSIAFANGDGNPKITFSGADQIQVVILAWLGLVSDPQGGTETTLTDPEGNTGLVSKSLLDSIIPMWMTERSRVFAAYGQRKTAVDAATSVAEVDAVDSTTPL